MRLDKYLKLARVIKRRTIANNICDNSKVSVGGRPVKAHYEVKVGDEIVITYGDITITHKVESIPYEKKRRTSK